MSTTRQSATTDQPNRRKARFADGGEVQSPEDEYRNAWQSGADDDQGDIAQHAAYAISRQAAQDTDAHSGSVAGHAAYAIGKKAGNIDFKVDKTGIVHASIGRVSFEVEKLAENAQELITTIVKLKPSSAKGTYVKSVSLSSTMSPGVHVEPRTVN